MPLVVKKFVRDDRKQVISIVEREDGRFSLVEEREERTDPCEWDAAGERYWATIESSSLYDNLETAQREMAVQFPWTLDARS